MLMEVYAQLKQLQDSLEGATVLNIYLLHKLGGQLTIDKDEMLRICSEFSTMAYGVNNGDVTIKLCSTPGERGSL